MNKFKRYVCYALFAIVVFVVFWLIVGFIINEYNTTSWEEQNRALVIILWIAITGCTIGYHEEKYKK